MTSSAAPIIETYFDCSSPWTYLGFHNLIPMAERIGAEIAWKPILVGGVFNAVNPSVYEARKAPVKAKARYHGKDLKDWTRLAGLKINMPPSVFPVNSVTVMRGCCYLLGQPDGDAQMVRFARAAFELYWSEDKDISQSEVIADVCARSGLVTETILAAAADPDIKQALRQNTDELVDRGGFGSPTFFVDGEMFFGNDRLILVEDAVKRAKAT